MNDVTLEVSSGAVLLRRAMKADLPDILTLLADDSISATGVSARR